MSDYTPIHQPGQAITSSASANVTGGQLVEVTGDNTVGPAAAGSASVVGQAGHDAASGTELTVHTLGGPVGEATASGAVSAGDLLQSAAGGQVATYTPSSTAPSTDTHVVGLALAGAAAGSLVRYQAR